MQYSALQTKSTETPNSLNNGTERSLVILERLEADDFSHKLLRKRMPKETSGDSTRDEDDPLALF